MVNTTYTLKVSSQGQLTLPRDLRQRLKVSPGSRVTVSVTDNGSLRLSGKLPIANHFGSMPGAWTTKGQDAADYTRKLRNSMQPKLHQ